MRRFAPFIAVLLLCGGLFCVSRAPAQVMSLTGAGLGKISSGGGLALDGTAGYSFSAANASGQVTVTSPTTANATDVVSVVALFTNTTGVITGVSGCSLSWSSRYSITASVSEWYAITSATISGCTITVTTNVAQFQNIAALAFAVSGANTSVPYDTNGSLPTITGYNAIPSPETTATNTLIYSIGTPITTVLPGSGFIALESDVTNNILAQYQIVSSAQGSGLPTPTAAGGSYYFAYANAIKKTGE